MSGLRQSAVVLSLVAGSRLTTPPPRFTRAGSRLLDPRNLIFPESACRVRRCHSWLSGDVTWRSSPLAHDKGGWVGALGSLSGHCARREAGNPPARSPGPPLAQSAGLAASCRGPRAMVCRQLHGGKLLSPPGTFTLLAVKTVQRVRVFVSNTRDGFRGESTGAGGGCGRRRTVARCPRGLLPFWSPEPGLSGESRDELP